MQTVDDDVCDPRPYSLDLDVTAGVFDLDATVTVLDDGDPPPTDTPDAKCVPPVDVSVLDASASEDDEALVFALEVTGAAPQADVSVDYALASGSAVAGADYSDVSGTLTIPAGARHATVTVPLVDDAVVEDAESFSLRLSNPAGMILAATSATGNIADDDSDTTASLPAVPQCERPVLRGSVAGVFDIAQARYSRGSHAFVDVDVTCGGEGSPVGLPVALSVVEGPTGSLGPSEHCVAQIAGRTVVASAAAAAGCATFAVRRPVSGVDDGRSTHLLRIPDASIGQSHQMLGWIDTDRDVVHDRGEPYQYVAANFVGRSVGGATLLDFGLPDDFAVKLVADGSDRIARSGFDSELLLRLSSVTAVPRAGGEPVSVTAPLANALVGASVSAGPSAGTSVMCLSTSGTASQCRTDADGKIIVRYRVGSDTTSVLRRTQDVLAVFHDPDQDGRRAFGASTSFVAHPIAKTVNYVALGDSYSSGENGRREAPGFEGSYIADNPAGGHCRRWDRAYPVVLKNEFLGDPTLNIDVSFETFACTGAETVHIYDPLDPIGTRQPSGAAPAVGEQGWEPRQSVSLGRVQAMSGVDLVTVTIGGNDAGFADVLAACVSPVTSSGLDLSATCASGEVPSVDDLAEVGDDVEDVLRRIKAAAPGASVFVLGYPHAVPCPPGVGGCDEPASREEIDDCKALSAEDILAHTFDFDQDYSILTLPFIPGLFAVDVATDVISMTGSALFGDSARISLPEAQRIWLAAERLNAEIEGAASDAGVHFVPVAEASIGHSGCAVDGEAWMHGYVLDTAKTPASSDKSFHPTQLGHAEIARLLEQYIRDRIADGVALSEAGLPLNPAARATD